jgi:hypothetical protein
MIVLVVGLHLGTFRVVALSDLLSCKFIPLS